MTESIPTRRHFNRSSLISLLAAMGMPDGTAVVQQQANSNAATRRDVIKQELPGEPFRDISLIEVTYPPATGSPPLIGSSRKALLGCMRRALDIDARGTRAITVGGVATLERLTISSPPTDGVVLRYGHLYGPGTGTNAAELPALHVDAAAWAAVLAIERARRGIYNIAEPSRYLSTEKAQRELGFDASVRLNAAA